MQKKKTINFFQFFSGENKFGRFAQNPQEGMIGLGEKFTSFRLR